MIGSMFTDSTILERIDRMRKSLEYIRDHGEANMNNADRSLLTHAWRWARREQVPDTPGNRESVRFYEAHAQRIADAVAERIGR